MLGYISAELGNLVVWRRL